MNLDCDSSQPPSARQEPADSGYGDGESSRQFRPSVRKRHAENRPPSLQDFLNGIGGGVSLADHLDISAPLPPLGLRTDSPEPLEPITTTESFPTIETPPVEDDNSGRNRVYRRVVPGLPRPQTFRRQDSERRERLAPHEPCERERREASASRRRALSAGRSVSPVSHRSRQYASPTESLPNQDLGDLAGGNLQSLSPLEHAYTAPERVHAVSSDGFLMAPSPWAEIPLPALPTDYMRSDAPSSIQQPPGLEQDSEISETFAHEAVFEAEGEDEDDDARREPTDEAAFQLLLETKWILNLSMTFRDRSPREKFFVTYAEQPNLWRRLTISCDYRDVPSDSLEADLRTMTLQRDKSAAIYRAIKDSLEDIQFFDTVTNLKLETRDDRLHVHVTEDVNEIINFPDVDCIAHLDDVEHYRESDLDFASHLSGFVYKVENRSVGVEMIKKEIPGPDMVDEFLYEIAALAALKDCPDVIDLQGVVLDDSGTKIKGLLIGFAEHGNLADILYDHTPTTGGLIEWSTRERWARQIVTGLSAIHESGFVQGDFTLSNVVVDTDDNARIIDINRRGCPVGWEPPEFEGPIADGMRLGLRIGVKSDIYQLGMLLHGLADHNDEPERRDNLDADDLDHDQIPQWYRDIVQDCLSRSPRNRPSAMTLLSRFPKSEPRTFKDSSMEVSSAVQRSPRQESGAPVSRGPRQDKPQYIDPKDEVTLKDIEDSRQAQASGGRLSNPTPSQDWTEVSESAGQSEAFSAYNSSKTSAMLYSAQSEMSPVEEAANLHKHFDRIALDALPRQTRGYDPQDLEYTLLSSDPSSQGLGSLARAPPLSERSIADMESRPETVRKESDENALGHSNSASTEIPPGTIEQRLREEADDSRDEIILKGLSHHDSGFQDFTDEFLESLPTHSSVGELVRSVGRADQNFIGIGAAHVSSLSSSQNDWSRNRKDDPWG